MFKLSDTMVLALLKKGMDYEIKDAEMEMDFPVSAFMMDEASTAKITVKCKMSGLTMKISQD